MINIYLKSFQKNKLQNFKFEKKSFLTFFIALHPNDKSQDSFKTGRLHDICLVDPTETQQSIEVENFGDLLKNLRDPRTGNI